MSQHEQLLKQLHSVARRLPTGLLHRLVADAQFFHAWNMGKRRARASSRLAQYKAWEEKAEDKYWKDVKR